jgi:hypothetical protein
VGKLTYLPSGPLVPSATVTTHMSCACVVIYHTVSFILLLLVCPTAGAVPLGSRFSAGSVAPLGGESGASHVSCKEQPTMGEERFSRVSRRKMRLPSSKWNICVRSKTMKNVVFWDMKTQFVPHRRHITSPLQTPAS